MDASIEQFGKIAPRAFGLQVAERLKTRWDVDLLRIADNDALTVRQKRKLMRDRLLESVLAELDEHRILSGESVDDNANAELVAAALAETEVELEPNFTMTQHNANIVKGYRGRDLYDYVYGLTKRFENMAAAKTEGQLAIEIVSGALVSVGIAMTALTIKAWRAGATLLSAVRTGVTGIGLKTAVTVVIFILVAFLLYLLLDNPKKILGMLINDTDDNLVVTNWRKGVDGAKEGDLYMAHGHIESFPQDHEDGDLDSPLVQLRKRYYFEKDDPENTVCCSVYFADRNFGFRGAEGVMLFSSKTTSLVIAHMFAVPYVNDNGTNMRRITGPKPDLEKLYREMYDTRKVAVDFISEGYRLTSAVNDPRGGVVALIASMTKIDVL